MLSLNHKKLRFFYGTTPQACPYIPNQIETKAITDLKSNDANYLHNFLSKAGFRRSHSLAYKPACPECNACMAARVRVEEFVPTKSMRRTLHKNSELKCTEKDAIATHEQFVLFQQYEKARHPGGDMASMNFNDFKKMIEDTPVLTRLVEYRNNNDQLIGVGITDVLNDGLSGVYTFFSPDFPKLSLGTFLILSHIFKARELNLPYFYLGYWIKGVPKMSYKGRFMPLEILTRSGWEDHKP